MLKFEFLVEVIIIFVNNIKKASNMTETIIILENLSFLRAQKVLKSQFKVETIIIFIKNTNKGIKWYIDFVGKSVI